MKIVGMVTKKKICAVSSVMNRVWTSPDPHTNDKAAIV